MPLQYERMGSRHRAIIAQLGGHIVLAEHLGLNDETVKSWRKTDRGIPPRYWLDISKMAGVSVEYLQRTSPRPYPAPRR